MEWLSRSSAKPPYNMSNNIPLFCVDEITY